MPGTPTGGPPLHWAAGEGLDSVRLLLAAGADPLAMDDAGATPLDGVFNVYPLWLRTVFVEKATLLESAIRQESSK